MSKWTFEATEAGYHKLWSTTSIKSGADTQQAETFSNKIIAQESEYRRVQSATGVPWFFVGALHMREGSCDLARCLVNGEKIIGTDRLTTIEPIGRGPYPTWADSAVDAMKLKNLHRVQDWSIERMLYSAEVYNGLGYVGKTNSPYVWAGTNHEQTGKFTRDHHFDPSFDDPQIGIACVLKALADMRRDIATAIQSSAPHPLPPAPQLQPVEELFPPTKPGDASAVLPVVLSMVLALLQRQQQAAPPATPGQAPQLDLLAILGPIFQAIGQPLPALPAPTVVPPPPPPPPPVPVVVQPAERSLISPSMGLGLTGVLGSVAAMATGNLGTPLGMGQEPTLAGNLVPLAFMAIPAIASWFGPVGTIIGRVIGAVGPALINQQQRTPQ